MPQLAHLPLILKPDGNGKLSKRDKSGLPMFPINWHDERTGEILITLAIQRIGIYGRCFY
jgi:glutamyl-tRNA synthetase